jgi:hypothetical protein
MDITRAEGKVCCSVSIFRVSFNQPKLSETDISYKPPKQSNDTEEGAEEKVYFAISPQSDLRPGFGKHQTQQVQLLKNPETERNFTQRKTFLLDRGDFCCEIIPL